MMNQKPQPLRRKFLYAILGGIGSLIAAVSVWPIFRFFSPRDADKGPRQVIIPRREVPLGKAHFFAYRGSPAVVVQPSAGRFIALSAVCTHLGCIVAWNGQVEEFQCPCHGGRFSVEGKVLAGPPPSPLPSYAIAVEGDQLRIG